MKRKEEIKPEGYHRCYFNIGIIGSFSKQINDIAHAKRVFEKEGFKVLAPIDTKISTERSTDGFLILEKDREDRPRKLEYDYNVALSNCQVVYVCDKDGYIGKSAMFEIGYLMYRNKVELVFQEVPKEELIVDMLRNSNDEIMNIMSPEELCKSMKVSNYYCYLDSKKYILSEIPSEAQWVYDDAPMENPDGLDSGSLNLE